MAKSLYFFADAALTQPLFSLPLGTAAGVTYTLADMSSYSDAGNTYYYTKDNAVKLGTVTLAGGVDMTGKTYGQTYTDGIYTMYIRDNNNLMQFGAWYAAVPHYHNLRGTSGTAAGYRTMCAIAFTVEGLPFLAVGWDRNGVFQLTLAFSENLLGSRAFSQQGGPDTPPGDGADANAGWGAYDFDSPGGLGSSMPSSPSLPVSENGRGLHAYTMDAAAYQVLGDALWGVGDSGSSIAFADMWQKWQNYKFNPTAGIISCIRLPDVFTPDRTGLTDTNIKLSGTWAVKGGQFASISGCKPADVSPISADVLSCSIPEQYGSWLDYDGGIEITLDLPFCGRMQIDPSACVGGGVSVQYRCDPCNGNCASFVFTTDRNGVTQLYNVAYGNCAFQVPLTGHDDGQVQMLGSFAGSAAALAGAAASPALAASAVVGAATTMMMRRETTQTVGAPSGSVAYVGNVSPTLIISYAHPVKSPGTLYADTEGQPCEYGGTIGSYTGFTIMHNVHAEIPAASAEEKEEIERLLESGVFL